MGRAEGVVMLVWLWMAVALAAQEPQTMARFGTTVVVPDGLRGQIYFLHEDTEVLPNFRKMKPKGTIYTTSLNVPAQNFELGFPGVTKRVEWFAIVYTGKFWVRDAGEYYFNLMSDDGSRLWIDGKLVVNNDGIHPPRESLGRVELGQGVHRLEVAYFQGPRASVALVMKVASPGKGWRIFQVDEFRPPAGK